MTMFVSLDRRFHGFCVGLPRSGTKSIANIFIKYRTYHEPLPRETIDSLLNNDKLADYFKRRDIRLQAEMESAHFLHHAADVLVNIFPSSKFVLSIRDPLAWIESEINMNSRTADSYWELIEKHRYAPRDFSPDDQCLSQFRNVWPVKNYFRYWMKHVKHVVDNVPPERLIVIKTEELGQSIHRLEQFFDLAYGDLDGSNVRIGHQPVKVKLFDLVDVEYVKSMATDCIKTYDNINSI